jgi:hypothetical protein
MLPRHVQPNRRAERTGESADGGELFSLKNDVTCSSAGGDALPYVFAKLIWNFDTAF